MNRREFVTASAFLAQRRGARRAPAPEARWRFSLDGLGRWSLARGGVVAVHGAEISVEIGGAPPVALSRLENARRIRTGSRRSGESTWTFVGRYQDLEVSAEFEDDERPSVTVRVRGLEQPHDLVAVHLTGGVSLSQRSAWINGYQSWSTCRIVDLPGTATGYWQIALRGGQGLAFVFGEDDGSSGEFHIAGRALDAVARF